MALGAPQLLAERMGLNDNTISTKLLGNTYVEAPYVKFTTPFTVIDHYVFVFYNV